MGMDSNPHLLFLLQFWIGLASRGAFLRSGAGTARTHPPKQKGVPGRADDASAFTGMRCPVRRVRGCYMGVNGSALVASGAWLWVSNREGT